MCLFQLKKDKRKISLGKTRAEKTCSHFFSWKIDINKEILTNSPLMNVLANFQACHQSTTWERTGKERVFWTWKTFSGPASGSSKMLLTGRVLNWNKQENNYFVTNRDCRRLSGYCRNFPITTIPTTNFPSTKCLENESITMDFHLPIASLEANQSYLNNWLITLVITGNKSSFPCLPRDM